MSRVLEILARFPQVGSITSRHKRHADAELYAVLKNCMELVEVCDADSSERAVLDDLIREQCRETGKRKYVEKSSDTYQRVCRFVFFSEEHNANTNRYAISLREAAKHGFDSATIKDALMKGGGINRFYLVRPDLTDRVSTKCIRLDKQISHHKDEEIILRLRRMPDNTYAVMDMGTVSPLVEAAA